MKYKLATTCFVIGAMLAPVAAYAEDTDAAITTKIKTQLAAEHFGSLKDISVDTDKNGVVWMSGTVNNQAEADQAIRIAHNTEGVKTVQSSLKVQNDR